MKVLLIKIIVQLEGEILSPVHLYFPDYYQPRQVFACRSQIGKFVTLTHFFIWYFIGNRGYKGSS